jgi:hypothetical protein
MEAEGGDVVSYLLIGLAGSCTNAFDLNQAFETDPLGTDITAAKLIARDSVFLLGHGNLGLELTLPGD